MPLYEYECSQCGKIVEVLQKFSDKPLKTCEHCSGSLHRIVSQSSFHLKGTGWYVTDYNSRSGTSSEGNSKTAETKTNQKADQNSGKSETSGSTSKSD
jgi:putative FmdB family regulatory protein